MPPRRPGHHSKSSFSKSGSQPAQQRTPSLAAASAATPGPATTLAPNSAPPTPAAAAALAAAAAANPEVSKYQQNLNNLRRRDPTVTSILHQFSHVCLYQHDEDGWKKNGMEGPMLVVER
jgi:hypothetical protein